MGAWVSIKSYPIFLRWTFECEHFQTIEHTLTSVLTHGGKSLTIVSNIASGTSPAEIANAIRGATLRNLRALALHTQTRGTGVRRRRTRIKQFTPRAIIIGRALTRTVGTTHTVVQTVASDLIGGSGRNAIQADLAIQAGVAGQTHAVN